MIHHGDPFAPIEDDPLRRFRGRLVAPVVIFTAGAGADKTGLTVSSLFVIEGEPPLLYAAVGPNSDLFDAVTSTGRFVANICHRGQEGMAEVFAGRRPSPGGMFTGVEWEQSEWGPVLAAMPNRAYCSTVSMEESGWSGLLVGSIDRIEAGGIDDPLVHFRGAYRGLG